MKGMVELKTTRAEDDVTVDVALVLRLRVIRVGGW